ncbi:MAG TPA: ATP-binding protein [Terriglobales bacterium]|nr:ATP-binding protein [Terriglobales bacterium]
MMAGLPGSGKSTLSRALAQRCGGIVLDKDSLRAALFPPEHIEYSREQDDFCQQLMLAAAEYLLSRSPKLRIFLDGRPFSRRYQRAQVEAAATRLRTPLAIIECVCSDPTALVRLQRDHRTRAHPAANRNRDLYAQLKNEFEPLTEPRLTVETDQPLPECVRQAEAYVERISQDSSSGQN